jgi:hypothetical protein
MHHGLCGLYVQSEGTNGSDTQPSLPSSHVLCTSASVEQSMVQVNDGGEMRSGGVFWR